MKYALALLAILACCFLAGSTPQLAANGEGCCKVCKSSCACGDSCISCSKTCHVGSGCACDDAGGCG